MNTIYFDEVVSVEKLTDKFNCYDITVKDNHNFFANNILVHNCQNIVRQYQDAQQADETFEASYKLHGSSITILVKDNQLEICSRNYSLRIPSVFEWNDVTNPFDPLLRPEHCWQFFD